jgi:hypothetical protein
MGPKWDCEAGCKGRTPRQMKLHRVINGKLEELKMENTMGPCRAAKTLDGKYILAHCGSANCVSMKKCASTGMEFSPGPMGLSGLAESLRLEQEHKSYRPKRKMVTYAGPEPKLLSGGEPWAKLMLMQLEVMRGQLDLMAREVLLVAEGTRLRVKDFGAEDVPDPRPGTTCPGCGKGVLLRVSDHEAVKGQELVCNGCGSLWGGGG